MSWTLSLDIALLLLLACAIAGGIVLNQRFHRARGDWQRLEELTGQFRAATERAEESIRALKLSARELNDGAARADALLEDLRMLIDHASGMADRLEAGIRSARDHVRTAKPSAPPPRAATPAGERPPAPPRSQAERALLEALRSVP